MKPIHFLLPAVALLIAGTWIGSQRQSIAKLEQQSAALQKHIATARAAGTADDASHSKPGAPGKTAKDKEPFDWKKFAAQFEEARKSGGLWDMRVLNHLRQRLMSMDEKELVAALEELAALNLPEESRAMVEQMLIRQLIEKDPEFALTQFIDRIHDELNSIDVLFSNAMTEWAKNDPAAATAWFDQQIAAGVFDSKSLDGKSLHRMLFEGALIGVLLSSDAGAANRRLATLQEDQRRDVLRHYAANSLKQEAQLAYANLIRQQLPEKDQASTIASVISNMNFGDDDYTGVTDYIDRIEATPAERTACVERAAESRFQHLSYKRKITQDDIEQLRAWTNAQSPELTDLTTGKALASALQGGHGKTEFSELAAFAVQYHDASGSDEVLVPLLEDWLAWNDENKKQARVLADKITDENRRAEILKKFE